VPLFRLIFAVHEHAVEQKQGRDRH
jgi:hypothetical protein